MFNRKNIAHLTLVTGFLGSGKSTFLKNFNFFSFQKAHCRWNRDETGVSREMTRPKTRNTAVVIHDRGQFLLKAEKKKTVDPYQPDRGETAEEDV
jgi:predicted ABC-type ATPase